MERCAGPIGGRAGGANGALPQLEHSLTVHHSRWSHVHVDDRRLRIPVAVFCRSSCGDWCCGKWSVPGSNR